MTNVEALKALYTALGGTASEFTATTTAEAIAQVATVAGTVATAAKTKELPTVTSSNNGQVLTVDGGKWKAKALPE